MYRGSFLNSLGFIERIKTEDDFAPFAFVSVVVSNSGMFVITALLSNLLDLKYMCKNSM